jgi:hypothetical protein
MANKYQSKPEPQLRQLTSAEIEFVSGGIIGGCVDKNYHVLWYTVQLDDNGKVCSVKAP